MGRIEWGHSQGDLFFRLFCRMLKQQAFKVFVLSIVAQARHFIAVTYKGTIEQEQPVVYFLILPECFTFYALCSFVTKTVKL